LFVVSMALAAWAVVLFMKDVVSYRPSVQYKVPRYERLSWLAAGITTYCALVPVGLALRSLAWLFLLVTLAAPIILHRLAITAIPELKLYRRSWWAFALTIPLAVLRYANVLPCWSIFEWALPAGFAVHGIMTSLALPAWASGMESKLAVVNEQLTHNVEELRQALTRAEEANQKAQRATKAKDEFVATMSHELRTPLNAIINIPQGLIGEFATVRSAKCSACSASYLLDQADVIGAATACSECKQLGTLVEGSKVKYRGDEARCLRFLQKIERSGQHLLQMVNGVLDYSKLEAGRFELVLGPVELEPLIREVSDQMSDLAQRKNIQLELQAGAAHKRPLMADLLRLKQVLINLLANAIKFSEAHSTVTIRWSSLPDGELIEVEDRGIGIAPEHQERIFSSFEQVHKGDTRKYGGTGLGLSISRSLVRMHGGELSVRSELGKGSTFVIRLPRMPTSTNSRPSGELRAAVDNSNGEALVVQGARS
jgi:signal transduction histidine kinase